MVSLDFGNLLSHSIYTMASPKKCRAATCTCLSQTGASLARHFPRWGPWRLQAEARAESSFGWILAICWGCTNFECDVSLPFAGFWQSTLTQHLRHGEPRKMWCINLRLSVTDRCESGTTFSQMGPWRLQVEAQGESSFGWTLAICWGAQTSKPG